MFRFPPPYLWTPPTPQRNNCDRRQRWKQGAVVGAAASKTRVPPKARSGCWVPQPVVKGCTPLTILKKWATPEKTEDSRLFGVKIFYPFFPAPPIQSPSVAARQLPPGEQARPQTLRFYRKLSRHAKGAPLGELLSAAKLRGYPIKTSIPRFLPVENSLQLCYDRKQRIFPKIDSEEGNGSCVKVVF